MNEPRGLGELTGGLNLDYVGVGLERNDLDADTVDFTLYHAELVLLAALVVDDEARVVADVPFLRVRVVVFENHHGGDVEEHLHDAVVPEQGEVA